MPLDTKLSDLNQKADAVLALRKGDGFEFNSTSTKRYCRNCYNVEDEGHDVECSHTALNLIASYKALAESQAARVEGLEKALREAKLYVDTWPIGLDTDPQEQRGGARDTMLRNIIRVLADSELHDTT